MSNELTFQDGMPITLVFSKANVEPNTTTALTLPQGGVGLKVPTGYAFHALLISGESNADISAGTGIFKATANTTVLTNGPSATLSDLVQVASGVMRPHAEPITAGKIVGVSVVTDANWSANTVDLDAVLVGVLLPA